MKNVLRIMAFAVCAILMVSNANAQTDNIQKSTAAETGGNVVVLLETASWGQNDPFNNQCWTSYGGTTHAKTGCVATAYAIVMRYHKFPKKGTANPLYNCQAPTYVEITDRVYDWDNMPLVYDKNWSEEQIYEVSKIMSHLAHANFSTFGTGGTTANEERETARLNHYFNYPKVAASYQRDYSQEQWEAKIRESLDNGCPVPYAANNSGTGDSRHMFVIDGYTDNGYFHFNFGWDGSGNGWFKLDAIKPYQGDDYSWKENSEHYANFNLKPDVVEEEEDGNEEDKDEENATTTDYYVKPSSGLDHGKVRFHEWESTSTAEYPATIKVTATDNSGNMVNAISQYNDNSHKFYASGEILYTGTLASSPTTYTLSVSEGYYIAGYSLTYNPSTGGKVTVENEYGYSETPASTQKDYVMSASDLHTTSTTFTVAGESAGHAIKTVNFTVTVGTEGNETGIDEVKGENEEAKGIYDLTGRRVEAITHPGIYIINGKKIFVK